jgi:hypothetical protein
MYCAGVLTFAAGFMNSSSFRAKCITEGLKTSRLHGTTTRDRRDVFQRLNPHSADDPAPSPFRAFNYILYTYLLTQYNSSARLKSVIETFERLRPHLYRDPPQSGPSRPNLSRIYYPLCFDNDPFCLAPNPFLLITIWIAGVPALYFTLLPSAASHVLISQWLAHSLQKHPGVHPKQKTHPGHIRPRGVANLLLCNATGSPGLRRSARWL